MSKIAKRISMLTPAQQSAFVQVHVPGRIRSIHSALQTHTYSDLAVAAIFSRAIASFLGLGTRQGRLCADRDYFQHALDQSWEVKVKDVGGRFLDLNTLSSADKSALEEGINETNTALAHLTFWSDSSSQDDSGVATEDYIESQAERIRRFAETVIRLFHEHTNHAKPD
jgi:hypothetical protein